MTPVVSDRTLQWLIALASIALVLLATRASIAAEPASDTANYECRWTEDPITIDGKADEPAWAGAQTIDRFRRAWEHENERPPKTKTSVKFLWDREYIYFFADMEDHDLYAKVTEHDGKVWTDDAFEIFFKPSKDKPGYYETNYNPANTTMESFFPVRDVATGWEKYRNDGDFHLKTAVQLRGTLNNPGDKDQGWTLEGRIPWKSFLRTGGRPNPGQRWLFAPCRVDQTTEPKDEELSSAAILKSKPHADFHQYEDYATLKFVGARESGAKPQAAYGLDKLPQLTTSKVVGSPDPPHPFRVAPAYPKLKIDKPVFVLNQPGSDRMWLVTQTSDWGPCLIRRFVDREDVSEAENLLEVNGNAYSLIFHPKFAENGYVYVGRNTPNGAVKRKNEVVRYKVDPKPPYVFDPKSETVIIEWESAGHDGLAMAFGLDGTLYITSGDGTSDSDRWLSGQDLSRLLAKVLRIDVDHPDPGKQYAVPKDNPFVGQPNVRPETWCYGMRNPWRMAVDPKSGNLWVGQNGQDQWEPLYLVERGANYGWSAVEGSHPFYPDRYKGPAPISKPIAEHPHADARSLTGGIVYYGSEFPTLDGAYLYGDYSTGKIWGIRVNEKREVTWHQEIADTTNQITAFAYDTKGRVLVTDHGGMRISRLEMTPKDAPHPEFPRTLSQSGLFEDVKSHAMADGILPYSVIAELWSDGAYKQRYIAIPRAGSSDVEPAKDRLIGVTESHGWEFPDETVLVKSFALERESGNPASRRWIETRFFTRQEGEWVGYSYKWNEEQTDAMLVDAPGLDQAYDVKDAAAPGGSRKVNWHYPSRSECMVCHTRQAGFVLGLQTPQMNRDQDYASVGGRVDNQLRVLEHLGLTKVKYAEDSVKLLQADATAQGLDADAAYAYVEHFRPQKEQHPAARFSPLLTLAPASTPKLANPRDTSAEINARVRSYLHSNCAICHVEAGGGNALMELEFTRDQGDMRLIDVKPLHDTFGIADAKLVAPGAPERSVLLKRLGARTIAGQPGQMPPLATNVPDEQAIKMFEQWIAQLPPAAPAKPESGHADSR
jgi:glucose/arabinose dehydrogenase